MADVDSNHVFFQISGTFQVNIPPTLLGYTWSNTYVPPREDCSGQNPKECTFLNIFATIEPQLSYITFNPKLDEVGFTLNYSETNHQKSINCLLKTSSNFKVTRSETLVFLLSPKGEGSSTV